MHFQTVKRHVHRDAVLVGAPTPCARSAHNISYTPGGDGFTSFENVHLLTLPASKILAFLLCSTGLQLSRFPTEEVADATPNTGLAPWCRPVFGGAESLRPLVDRLAEVGVASLSSQHTTEGLQLGEPLRVAVELALKQYAIEMRVIERVPKLTRSWEPRARSCWLCTLSSQCNRGSRCTGDLASETSP